MVYILNLRQPNHCRHFDGPDGLKLMQAVESFYLNDFKRFGYAKASLKLSGDKESAVRKFIALLCGQWSQYRDHCIYLRVLLVGAHW